MSTTTDNPVRLEIIHGAEWKTDDEGWEHYEYRVRLTRGTVAMTIPWRQGMALMEDPTVERVLEALLSDAATIENAQGDFEQWAPELGYDADSRRAEAIFKAASEQTERLRELLGEDFDSAVFPRFEDDPYLDGHEREARRLTTSD